MIALSKCSVALVHRPVPTRYVVHHIQPQVCGGLSVPANQITLCDNCHYTIHRIMYGMRMGTPNAALGNRRQRQIATSGYQLCLAAGTVNKIPNEG